MAPKECQWYNLSCFLARRCWASFSPCSSLREAQRRGNLSQFLARRRWAHSFFTGIYFRGVQECCAVFLDDKEPTQSSQERCFQAQGLHMARRSCLPYALSK
jgi:hypothetical protein